MTHEPSIPRFRGAMTEAHETASDFNRKAYNMFQQFENISAEDSINYIQSSASAQGLVVQ